MSIAAPTLSKGTKVFFKARKESGAGVLIAVLASKRGYWYQVQRTTDKELFKCRISQVEVRA